VPSEHNDETNKLDHIESAEKGFLRKHLPFGLLRCDRQTIISRECGECNFRFHVTMELEDFSMLERNEKNFYLGLVTGIETVVFGVTRLPCAQHAVVSVSLGLHAFNVSASSSSAGAPGQARRAC
jgi:hypothetical protein